ncbi:MAG TPA: HD domain-containing phosphohydrolase [Gemmatimonadales bacterium]|nr:HD domain-containing phosphohydrolase [Gemmatimonadales bacterium]
MPLTDGPASILVVDDDAAVRVAVSKYLVQRGYEVLTAETGEEALDLLRRRPVTGMLLDVRLPGASGVELVPRVVEREPCLALVMLTAVNDATSAALCMQRGAMDYLIKPVDLDDLERALRRALDRRREMLETRHLQERLTEEVARRSAELREERANLERVSLATLDALVNALEAKDPYLRGHSARVAHLTALTAAALGRSADEIEAVRTAARLHDVGEIGVREAVLGKQGPLSDQEYEHVKQHVVVGAQILAPLVHLRHVIPFVRGHHERWDGSGYPDRLAGEAIPWGARVIGGVEIYDALTTRRPYQAEMEPAAALARMADLAGSMIDPAVYRALAVVVERRAPLLAGEEQA